MCGICGIYNKGSEEIIPETIITMRDVMTNRGPDDAGLYIGPHIGLGHRRLSIIDLSVAGNQPLSNEDGAIWLVVNGEIYNFPELRDRLLAQGHVFRSQTDAEVLIHGYEEWGLEDLLQKINGMFAFAIWDSKKEELILVRDRLGVKPLFYLESNGKVYFSSDIKSIWLGSENELVLNYEAFDHFLYSYSIPQQYSIFQEVRKVLPAHYVRFNKNKTFMNKYWDLSFATKEEMEEEEYVEEVQDRLVQAVKRRLISDVPLGAFLSGGVDSSLVVAMMANLSDYPVKTFSIGFQEESHNELKYARKVAEHYATEHHEFIIEPDAIAILPQVIWSHGEPFADSSQIPAYYVANMTKKHVKVALTGDGGDESFGGYNHIAAHYFGSLYRKYLPSVVGDLLFPAITAALVAAVGRRGLISKMKTLTEYGSRDFINSYRLGGIFRSHHRENLYTPEFKSKLSYHDPSDIFETVISSTNGWDDIDKALYVDFKTLLPNTYLTKVDIATMMNSLEARSPFLDYKVVEFAARIPAKIKVKHGQQKYLLKKVASKFVPHDVIYRKKWGFAVPIGSWLRENLASLTRNILLSEAANKRGYFSVNFVRRLLDEHLSGACDHRHRLWTLLCFELWHLMFVDKVITAETKLR